MWKYVAATLAFILAAWFALSQTLFDPSGGAPAAVGEISQSIGDVTSRPSGGSENRVAGSGRKLGAREILSTGPGASAVLDFPGGARLKLLENSRAVAEPVGSGQVHVTVLAGDVAVLAPGAAGSVSVYKDGRRIDGENSTRAAAPVIVSGPDATAAPPAADSTASEEATIAPTAPEEPVTSPQSTPPRTLPQKASARAKSLTDEDIHRVMAAQGSRFQRCFLDYLKRRNSTEGKGTISVAFVIASSGNVQSQRIVNSPFADSLLHSCVAEVVDRAPFPSFEGGPIRFTDNPIRFE